MQFIAFENIQEGHAIGEHGAFIALGVAAHGGILVAEDPIDVVAVFFHQGDEQDLALFLFGGRGLGQGFADENLLAAGVEAGVMAVQAAPPSGTTSVSGGGSAPSLKAR